jgi:hypothetical protein
MSRRVFIYVNGILNLPGSSEGWTDRAVTWTHLHVPGARAEKCEYFSGVLTRRVRQQRRAEKIARMIRYYAGEFGGEAFHEIHLVGHSNGCDLICRVLALLWDCPTLPATFHISSVRLISGAVESDFRRNRLNQFLAARFVREVHCLIAEHDLPMSIAAKTYWLLKPFGLGYGTLGFDGPEHVEPEVHRHVRYQHEMDFGHSTWFEPEHFDQTMKSLTA